MKEEVFIRTDFLTDQSFKGATQLEAVPSGFTFATRVRQPGVLWFLSRLVKGWGLRFIQEVACCMGELSCYCICESVLYDLIFVVLTSSSYNCILHDVRAS